jgi:hypothetical protein
MRRWNGWGDDTRDYPVPPALVGLLTDTIGAGREPADVSLPAVRLGLLLPNGGAEIFATVRRICQQELSWTEDRWSKEETAYAALIAR